jgi:uncharacterized protein YuzE
MKVRYDRKTDTLSLIFRDNTPVFESDEDKPGVILDYDKDGNLISLEILDASRRVLTRAKLTSSWPNRAWSLATSPYYVTPTGRLFMSTQYRDPVFPLLPYGIRKVKDKASIYTRP